VVDDHGHRWNGSDVRPPRWHRTPPPVRAWATDEYAIVALSVPLLPGTPPGTYTIEAVAFARDTLAPLTAHAAGGRALGPALTLGQITVAAPQQPADPDLLGIHHPLDASLGPITLLGADLNRHEAAPGDAVLLTTFWRADRQPTQDLTVHLALLAQDGSPVAGYDLPPTARWHPTSTWQPGDVWRGQHVLNIPADLDSANYSWQLSTEPIRQSTNLPSTLHVAVPDRTFTPPLLDVETDIRLGTVATLVGANLKPETLRAEPTRLSSSQAQAEAFSLKSGNPLTITLVWRAEDTPSASYHVFLHLLAPDDTLVAQSDGVPAGWSRPTTGWMPGEIVLDERVIEIPTGAEPGEYRLQTGMYTLENGRLVTPSGTDTIQLAVVVVQDDGKVLDDEPGR